MKQIERIQYQKSIKEMQNFEIVDLQLFFSTRPRRMLEKDYRLDFWSILYIIDGNGVHFIDFRPFKYQAGSVIFIRRNQVQHFEINSRVKGYIIHINEAMMLQLNDLNTDFLWDVVDTSYGSPVVQMESGKASTTRLLVDLIYNEYNQFSERDKSAFIKSLFESFILSIERELDSNKGQSNTTDYIVFKKFRKLVENHYTERMPLEFYEKKIGLSKKTINLATRRMVDMSAKEYINQRLHLEIKRYLSQGELMIYEIAELLGFDEPANMTKFFKRYEKITPKDFRKVCIKE
ncbi:AraC family transcriptional regulator [Eubacteriaceae bacterium ES2]|nr:AraC family transcriptional regulator [Eubacteriaceae bacterium ES2]